MMDKKITESALRELWAKAKIEDSRTRIAINEAMKALKKQIPKKPEKQDENCLECPNCDSFIAFESEARDDTNYQDEYCRNCGQAIDWE